jgi:hypothetical protein
MIHAAARTQLIGRAGAEVAYKSWADYMGMAKSLLEAKRSLFSEKGRPAIRPEAWPTYSAISAFGLDHDLWEAARKGLGSLKLHLRPEDVDMPADQWSYWSTIMTAVLAWRTEANKKRNRSVTFVKLQSGPFNKSILKLDLEAFTKIETAVCVVRFILMFPISSAEVERVFSVVKAVGNPRRTRLRSHRRFLETRCRCDRVTFLRTFRRLIRFLGLPAEDADRACKAVSPVVLAPVDIARTAFQGTSGEEFEGDTDED